MTMSEQSESVCEMCHRQPPTTTVFRREWQQHQPVCDACAQQHAERVRQKRRERHESTFRRCRFGQVVLPRGMTHDDYEGPPLPDWPWARFANPTFRELADPVIFEAAESWRIDRQGLVLAGPTGAAKTASLVAWAYSEHERRLAEVDAGGNVEPFDFVFLTGFDLAKARAQHSLGEGEAPAVRAAFGADVLLLDEVGFESLRDTAVLEVINQRVNQRMPTLLTTGRTPEEFAERYGAACWRRFAEGAKVAASFPNSGH